MKQLRYAFRLMWRGAPRQMRRYSIPEEGSFDKHNGHNGVCWGWPKECSLTDTQARAIFNACYESGKLTMPMMVVLRKGMAYRAALVYVCFWLYMFLENFKNYWQMH